MPVDNKNRSPDNYVCDYINQRCSISDNLTTSFDELYNDFLKYSNDMNYSMRLLRSDFQKSFYKSLNNNFELRTIIRNKGRKATYNGIGIKNKL